MRELVLRPHVARAVALELEIAVDGAHVDDPVEVRVEVVAKARRRHLLRGAAAADDLARLEHEDALARLGEVAGTGQAVVPSADHDHVVLARHASAILGPAVQPAH